MLKRKSNCICNKSLLCCPSRPNTRKQENKLHSNVKMQTMFLELKKKYRNISPMNDFKIVILGYCIHFFDSIVFIGFQCPIPSTPCKFQRLCISNSTCPNCLNKVLVLFKACPCTLWDEPHPPCWNPNDAQQDLRG
jgi:hypothetical protein